MPKEFQRLIDGNRQWVKDMEEQKPGFFKKLAAGQTPEFLWIGCSDSRVPTNEVTNTLPGEIFVHRNIANLVINTDMNLMSVLQYAVEVLKVKHILVVGHYGCGGVIAAMGRQKLGLIDNWIRNIKDVYNNYQDELQLIPTDQGKVNRLVELNVIEQVRNLAKTSVVQEAWAKGDYPIIHGIVYDVADGILKELNVRMREQTDINEIYHYDIKV
jgi:carbonic anhydrase